MKIVKINAKDIVFDYKNASDILNSNCFGKTKRYVAGGYFVGDNFLAWLEDIDSVENPPFDSYVFSQITETSEDTIVGEVQNRAAFGFTTITFFEYNDKLWGLFARKS